MILLASVSHARPSPPALSSVVSAPQSLRLCCSRRPTGPGRSSLERRAVRCSISQVYSYGTVDYERRPPLTWHALYRRISMMEDRGRGAAAVLEAWVGEGMRLTKWELARVVKELRKFRRYKFALQVYEWITEREDMFKINTSDVAIQLDLIYKVRGISNAEDFFSKLPDSLKDMRTYGSLLNVYARANMKEKAEATLKTMKEGFTIQTLSYNVMMTLYMNLEDYDQALSMISEMEDNNLYLDVYSFNIWITICGKMGNVEEMEKVVERMKLNDKINPNWTTYSTLASMYIKQGFLDKAEACLKDVELRVTGQDKTPFHYLLSLYSSLGKKEEVHRVWNCYKSSFRKIPNLGYHAVISSLARVGDIEGAEDIYEEWASKQTSYDPRICNIIIGWYVKEGLVDKAEAFFDNIRDGGCMPNANTWEVLAEGNMRQKNILKALSYMKEAASIKKPRWQPKPANVCAFLDLCKAQGDSTSAESFTELLREIKCLNMENHKSVARENNESNSYVEELKQGDVSSEYSDSEAEMDVFADQQREFNASPILHLTKHE